MEWPLMSECVGREETISIMNDKRPNKHICTFGSLDSYSFTYDDQENDWQQLSHNFYFLEGEDAKIHYFNAEDGKNFFLRKSKKKGLTLFPASFKMGFLV